MFGVIKKFTLSILYSGKLASKALEKPYVSRLYELVEVEEGDMVVDFVLDILFSMMSESTVHPFISPRTKMRNDEDLSVELGITVEDVSFNSILEDKDVPKEKSMSRFELGDNVG
ncbi:hypothetical protein AgCh_002371 [Apium graveolens]